MKRTLIAVLWAACWLATATAAPPAAPRDAAGRPPCPAGWTDFKNPLIGMQAQVPPNF